MSTDSADLKLVLLGQKQVGKTSLFNQYVYKEVFRTTTTIGAYFAEKNMTLDEETYKVAIWDTAGEERFSALTSFYTRQTNCAVIVYDVTDKNSFRAVERWCNQLDSDCVIIIAGNKIDLLEQSTERSSQPRDISLANIQQYAKSVNALTIEGSALTGLNVSEMFENVVAEYIKRKGAPTRDNHSGFKVKQQSEADEKKKSCC